MVEVNAFCYYPHPMKFVIAFLLLSCLGYTPTFAAALSIPAMPCACDQKIRDPLEEPIRFGFGKFQGQCVDSCRFRRARILKEQPDTILVGNILHLGHYLKGKINLKNVTGIQAGFERFAPGVDHVLLRFEISEDVKLFSQNSGNKPVATTRSFVISSEGVPPKGHNYSMMEGYWGQYLIADRLVTGEELEHLATEFKHSVRLFPLHLSGPQAAKILANGIHHSESASFQSRYQLFANNCSTSALSLIDGEIGFKKTGWNPFHWTEFEEALPIAGPVGTARALRIRGLIDADDSGLNLFSRAEAHP